MICKFAAFSLEAWHGSRGRAGVRVRVSWISCVTLNRFVRAVRHGSLSSLDTKLGSSNSALAVWVNKFEIPAIVDVDGPSLSADEAMLK